MLRLRWGGRVVIDASGNVKTLCAESDELIGNPTLQKAISSLRHVRSLLSGGSKGDDLLLAATAAWPADALENVSLRAQVGDDALTNLERFQKLLIVHISSEHTTDGAFRHLAKLKNLEQLAIGPEKPSNRLKITGSGLGELSGLKRLNALDLVDCPINDVGMSKLKGVPIKELQLRRPALTDRGVEALSEVSTLEVFGVSDAAITDKSLAYFGKLKNLWCLSLGHCPRICGSGLKALVGLEKLTCLSLDDCPIDDAALKDLGGTRLNALNLRLTNITDRAVDEIEKMTTLEELYVGDTKLSKGAIARLKKIKGLRVDDLPVRKP
jgi:hypothetical protein